MTASGLGLMALAALLLWHSLKALNRMSVRTDHRLRGAYLSISGLSFAVFMAPPCAVSIDPVSGLLLALVCIAVFYKGVARLL